MKTVTWTGRIAWIGWRSCDGRLLTGSMVTRPRAPVLWRPPEADGCIIRNPLIVGTVVRLLWQSPWTDGRPVAQAAVLELDLEAVNEIEETVYPEADLASYGSRVEGLTFPNPVLIGLTLGTRPIWTDLDPVLQVTKE